MGNVFVAFVISGPYLNFLSFFFRFFISLVSWFLDLMGQLCLRCDY